MKVPVGILAGGILGFRIAGFVRCFAPSLRSCSDVLGFAFLKIQFIGTQAAQFELSGVSLLFFVVLVWGFVCLFDLLFFFSPVVVRHVVVAIVYGHVGLRTGPCSLLIPQ